MAKDILRAETSLRLLGGVPMQVGTSLTHDHKQGVLFKGKEGKVDILRAGRQLLLL